MRLKFLALSLTFGIISLGIVTFVFAVEAPPAPVCGNGVTEAGEECDDGNHTLTDLCDTFAEAPKSNGECTLTFCGDGAVQSPNGSGVNPNEKCDDQNEETALCTSECGQKMMGWAWSSTFGWLSLNDDNCLIKYLNPDLQTENPDICRTQTIDYYVQITANNEVVGYAWSDNIGWFCFGSRCTGNPLPGVSPNTSLIIDPQAPESPQVKGWAKAEGFGDNGWFSLNCENDSSCGNVEYQTLLIKSDFDGTCSKTASDYCVSNSDCPAGEECFREQRFTLSGWAWNDNIGAPGLGWLQFNPVSEISPWLQTEYGDIYALRGITGGQAPGYNATYRILANDTIVNFSSARGTDSWWVDREFGPLNFPMPQTRYSNALGQLDVNGLICDFTSGGNTCVNKYGKTVVDLKQQPLASQQLLGGKIYYHEGDLTIGSSVEFLNGSGFDDGSGTIIIKGNLVINSDITYDDSDDLTRFRNLASVAWIVLGDLKISPNVPATTGGKLAGNFIVIGAGENSCSPDPDVEVAGCGQIYSCGSLSECNKRLTVSGLMMARKFFLKRTFTEKEETPIQGSEIIIYDGRLLANTPPGLGDFAKALPIWRSGTFSR
ncbi:MAG: hypothetical protein WC675_05745 [Patescibacteria group bacterium]|jgi:cysteine-rich repeat protein